MRLEKGHSFFLLFIVVGGILGSVIGALLVEIFPSLKIITKEMTDFLTIDLQLIKIAVRLTISSVVGITAGIIVFFRI